MIQPCLREIPIDLSRSDVKPKPRIPYSGVAEDFLDAFERIVQLHAESAAGEPQLLP